MEEWQQRIIELERRVALLEGGSPAVNTNASDSVDNVDRSGSLVHVKISNKRYSPQNPSLGEYEEHIWFNVSYVAGTLDRPARALKGLLCFADIFGEVKFRINVTVTERLDIHRPLIQEGIGFTFNQFIPEHQWMLATKEADMKVSFLVTNVMYADGSSEEFR